MKRLAVAFAITLLGLTSIPASASTTTDAEHLLFGWINQARSERGLENFLVGKRIWDIAGHRAAVMAKKNVLSHTVAGSIKLQLNAKDVPWYGYGEDIGYSPKKSAASAAAELFQLWRNSPTHWKLMMSSSYNYIGIGMSYRSSNHRWYSSLIFTESPDLTGGRVTIDDAYRNDHDVTWAWRGWDPVLQTHTSGIDDFDVQVRKDSGDWVTLAKGTTATTKTRAALAGGHWYSLRVRARDRRGNVGPWSGESRIWVP